MWITVKENLISLSKIYIKMEDFRVSEMEDMKRGKIEM